MLSTPNTPTRHPSHSWPVVSAPKSPQIQGKRTRHPLPRPAGEVSIWNPYGSDRRDPNTHSRRTRSKLRQLHCTRQGLVRVPESNTKYGGKRRKTGVASCPLCRQVSVSPQGFPSEKNCFHRADFSFVPLFTWQLFIALEGLLLRDSGEATQLRAAMPARRWPPAQRTGKVPQIPTG